MEESPENGKESCSANAMDVVVMQYVSVQD
jgi:hypothetical protein